MSTLTNCSNLESAALSLVVPLCQLLKKLAADSRQQRLVVRRSARKNDNDVFAVIA